MRIQLQKGKTVRILKDWTLKSCQELLEMTRRPVVLCLVKPGVAAPDYSELRPHQCTVAIVIILNVFSFTNKINILFN